MHAATKKKAQHKRPTAINLSMPLVNPQTLFSASVWADLFNFIGQHLTLVQGIKAEKLGNFPSTELEIEIKDLYFAKIFSEAADFPAAKEKLASFGEAELRLDEPNDRNDEEHLTLSALQLSFHEYKGATCLSIGGAQGMETGMITDHNHFQNPPVIWNMTIQRFCDFSQVIEELFLPAGSPDICRAFIRVRMKDRAEIFLRAVFVNPQLWPSRSGDKANWKLFHKYLAPKFTVTFD